MSSHSDTRPPGERLAAALLPVLLHRIQNTTQLLIGLRSLIELAPDELSSGAAQDLARASQQADEQGWLLGLLAQGLGADLLLAREERRGLSVALELVREGLRREQRELALPRATWPALALAPGAPRSAALCVELAGLLWDSCVAAPAGRVAVLTFAHARGALQVRLEPASFSAAQGAFERSACAASGAELAAAGDGWELRLPGGWFEVGE